ncbi:hypothetical protein F5887DRAFT_1274821 [Amanita rubescens]|nr:hypothetical protein F5887DRAFT_1274821 [Amanita rubescens]
MRGSRDESLAEQGAPSREGEKQDQGQDQLHVGGGAWFNPWSWYGSSYASDAARDGGERSSTDAARDGGERSLTDAQPDERDEKPAQNHRDEKGLEADSTHRPVADESGVEHIPSEAEIQMTVADSSESVPSPSIMGTVEINPIVATMDTHRSSWLSFFASRTSRTLVVKSIEGPSPDSLIQIGTKTTEVDENGMEVMDISDDGVPPPSQPVPVPIEIPKAKEIKPTSPAPPSQSLVATLVRGRGKVRGSQPRTEQDTGSDTSSIKSVGQRSGAVTPAMEINGTSGTATPPRQDTLATAGSLSSSPKSTTSLVKRASLTLTNAKVNGNSKKPDSPKSVSPTPSSTSKKQVTPPPPPNLILPTWQDAFHTAPRNVVPRPEPGTLTKTVQYVSGMLFSGGRSDWPILGGGQGRKDKGKRRASSLEREREHHEFGKALPRAWDVLDAAQAGATLDKDVLRGCKRVVVIGVHGWFPGAVMRTVIGEPTGTSSKLANMMVQALEEFQSEHNVKLEKVTKIPLEGEGTINRRVDKLYDNLLKNQEWMDDIHAADAILLSTHSQGSVVSTHLLDRLISEKHIRTARNGVVPGPASSFSPACGMNTAPVPRPQKVCCLAMCGIHLGPLRYLSTTSLFQPYFQYIESPAARELFEFQNTEGEVSKDYVRALSNVLGNGVKMVYVASLNDQVVPIYSGVFTAASHPLILRALYIDGDAYHSSDFLANLLVLLLRILNSGISDSGLLAHLSEATAGSLNGVGHSTAYEEIATYALAVKYLFLSNDGLEEHPDLILEPFNARQEQNDYEIPWALRDVIADQRVVHFFSKEIVQLRDAFRGWYPRTSILRELKRKLQPIQRLPASFATTRL